MAVKRFTDAEKWKDPFFEELTNDYKLIWLYLLDDVDNAGLWHKSIKRLNFYCNTEITEEELYNTFKNRVKPISEDKWFIPKFMEFQYGSDWINSNGKAVVSAINKLEDVGIINNNTLSILYQYPIDTLSQVQDSVLENENTLSQIQDTPKDKDKDKEKDKVKEKEEDKSMDKSKEQDKEKVKDIEIEFDELFKDI
jgi:hypothetical protein